MATTFIPRNKCIKPTLTNIAGAELLREILGEDARISGVGCAPYTRAKTAEKYAKRLEDFLKENPTYKHSAFIRMKAIFFRYSGGFWQK